MESMEEELFTHTALVSWPIQGVDDDGDPCWTLIGTAFHGPPCGHEASRYGDDMIEHDLILTLTVTGEKFIHY